VAREFKGSGGTEERDDIFASTPTPSSLRLLLLKTVNNQGHVLRTADVTSAFLHAKLVGPAVYTKPPEEWGPPQSLKNNGEVIWRVERSLYGRRNSPRSWQDHLCDLLAGFGFKRGRSDGSVFYNGSSDVTLVVHVDDIAVGGPSQEVDGLLEALSKQLLLKTCPALSPENPLTFLGRRVTQDPDGTIRVQPSHNLFEKLGRLLGLSPNTNGKSCPMSSSYRPEEGNSLSPEDHGKYRSLVGLVLYLAGDRPDIQYAAKTASRALAAPYDGDMKLIKHLGRYLLATRYFVPGFGLPLGWRRQ
jgi:hypothetical protein